MNRRILVVEDDESLRRVMEVTLARGGYRVETVPDGERAVRSMEREPFDLVVSDLQMPGLSGLELLKRIRSAYPDTPVLLITAFGTVETAVEAMKAGAFDYLTKPVSAEELRLAVERALNQVRMREEIQALRSSIDAKYGFENIIGRSPGLMYLLDVAARAAQSDSTVLIHGETGTGKELIAKAIHFNSPRRLRPMVAINCAAIPRELIESELFGHVKGAFTGAIAHKKGKIELANGGTLFLDEVGELPPELQVKLLRVLQEREIEKVGGMEPVKVDIRVVAATHRNLHAMIDDGQFRQDLFYRLAVIPLEIPPLRERLEDIPPLVEGFFAKAKAKVNRPELELPDALMPYFTAYRWPGNVRELENVIERLAVLARGNVVTLEDLPPNLRQQRPAPSGGDVLQLEFGPAGISLEGVEKELLLRALKKFDWNQSQAAKYLDLSRKTLIYRMEKYGLSREEA